MAYKSGRLSRNFDFGGSGESVERTYQGGISELWRVGSAGSEVWDGSGRGQHRFGASWGADLVGSVLGVVSALGKCFQ